MKGNVCSPSGRSFQAATSGSRRAQSAETVDLEQLVPHSSSVMAVTLRVETPLTTISMSARTTACSLR
jgi:hypothetical protein